MRVDVVWFVYFVGICDFNMVVWSVVFVVVINLNEVGNGIFVCLILYIEYFCIGVFWWGRWNIVFKYV